MAQTPSTPTKRIKKLDENVVARIAAGEVVHSPSTVIKELLENSLDASAKMISVTCKDGGMKLLQIQDDGSGILAVDMPLVCCRHTTSKISTADDLKSLTTFGFRGEALASVSHVAHVTIQSMVAGQPVGYKMNYVDGNPDMKGVPAGQEPKAKPFPCKKGTTVIVEDLFYNDPRRKTIKNLSEEYNKVADVIKKYSINNSGISFSCRKLGESLADVQTNQVSTVIDNIRHFYGENVSSSLVQVEIDKFDTLGFKMNAYVSSTSYSGDKSQFILFINKRLMGTHKAIKKELSTVYEKIKGGKIKFFVYMSLTFKTDKVDVNIHPQKLEVRFLNEDKVVQAIAVAIAAKLEGKKIEDFNSPKKPTSNIPTIEVNIPWKEKPKENAKSSTTTSTSSSQLSTDMIQTTLDRSRAGVEPEFMSRRKKRKAVSELTSIQQMWNDVENNIDNKMGEVFSQFRFVGIVDRNTSLLQYKHNLYTIDNFALSKELAHQIILINFGKFRTIELNGNDGLPLFDLMMIGLESEQDLDIPIQEIEDIPATIQKMVEFLATPPRAPMLLEYFGIKITPLGIVHTLPIIFEQYIPPIHYLPLFLINLAAKVDWEAEKPCLSGISQQLADFYAIRPATDEMMVEPNAAKSGSNSPTPSPLDQPNYPVTFKKESESDHPLQRALNFYGCHGNCHIFAQEYIETSKGSHFYEAWDLPSWFEQYSNMNPHDRHYEDVMKENFPLKFYADLEFDPLKYEENVAKEKTVNEMSRIFKKYVEKLWLKETGMTLTSTSWLEFDASKESKRVSRHIHNDSMIFENSDHISTFIKKLRDMVLLDKEKGVEDADKLIVFREKNSVKKQELFFDMLVYGKNRCLRLPWSSKPGEYRPFLPVIDGVVQRGIIPKFEMLQRVLGNFFKDGKAPMEPFAYKSQDLRTRSPTKKINNNEIEKSQYHIIIENSLLPAVAEYLHCPKNFKQDGVIVQLQVDTNLLLKTCKNVDK